MKDMLTKLRTTGFFDIVGCSVINKAVSFLANVVLVNILSKSEYGVFTYAWNIYTIILLANGLGMESGALQLGSENINNAPKNNAIFNCSTRTGIVFDFLLSVVILLIGLFAPLKMHQANYLLKLTCGLPMVQFLYSMSIIRLRAQRKNTEYARITTINTILLALCSIVGAYLYREIGLILGYYVAYSMSVFVSRCWYKTKLVYPGLKLAAGEIRDLFSISLISMANNGLSQLMYLLDVLVLGIVTVNEEVLASYKVATTIPTALTFIPLALITYLYPYFAEHRDDKAWCLTKYKQILPVMGGINAIIAVGLAILAPYIVPFLFGQQYTDAVPIFRLLMLNYFLSGTFRTLSGNLLVTQRKLKFNLFNSILTSSINIIADYYFIGMWGSAGAAYATILVVAISSVLSTSYLIFVLTRKNKPNE